MSSTWDPAQPADNVAARLLPSVIRSNQLANNYADASWKPWAVNLEDRVNGSATSDDPSAIDAAFILYSKKTGLGANDPLALYGRTFDDDTNPTFKLFDPSQQDAASGYCSLPGGLVLQFGTQPFVADTATVTFPYTDMTTLLSVATSLYHDAAAGRSSILITARSATGFTATIGSSILVSTLEWIAIGI